MIWLWVVGISLPLIAQNKSGNSFVFGSGGMIADFQGDTSRPTTRQLFPLNSAINFPYFFELSNSNICDCATGKLLMLCNGAILYDTLGNIIENGDSLIPPKVYTGVSTYPTGPAPQTSIILPKGSNGLYYVITPTLTDSAFDFYVTGGQNQVPLDLLQYHVVDMNANGGMGKVVKKNVELLSNVKMSKVGMTAVRHANGYDWWLVKQGHDTNMVYTFLVTKDTIELKHQQGFGSPHFGYWDTWGQSCFSYDGKKYAYGMGTRNKLFIADFNRCSGEFSNSKIINIPIDSSTHPYWNSIGKMDSSFGGVAFSENNKFIYIAKAFNIYQYELNEVDSALAWYRVKHGEDTTLVQFAYYMQLLRGIDGRIYIGKFGGTGRENSVIDNPNMKGVACGFCRKCLRYDAGIYSSESPANIPNINLGVDSSGCWPLGSGQWVVSNEQLEVFPNPTSTKIVVRCRMSDVSKELYNSVGQMILSTKENEIDVSKFSQGLYYLKVGNETRKVIVE
jgi:hypothetical protein